MTLQASLSLSRRGCSRLAICRAPGRGICSAAVGAMGKPFPPCCPGDVSSPAAGAPASCTSRKNAALGIAARNVIFAAARGIDPTKRGLNLHDSTGCTHREQGSEATLLMNREMASPVSNPAPPTSYLFGRNGSLEEYGIGQQVTHRQHCRRMMRTRQRPQWIGRKPLCGT